jgi:hypothetical protein
MARQIFFLTSNSLTAWQYDGRALTRMGCFVAAEAGLAAFDTYLQQLGSMPALVLTDMVEEDFRIDSIAHTHGGDRAALLARHAARVYRGTGYRHAQLLGRDPHNKRKDEVLFSGLLNPEFADMWLDAMRHHKVPVAGIFSLPLLSGELMKRLCGKRKDVLFVTHNATSGLRQSFFAGGKLRFSRLTPVPDDVADDYAAFVHAEIGKTKRYLSNLHLLGRDVVLDVCMLSGGVRLDDLVRMRESEALTHYDLVAIEDAARKLGYRGQCDAYRCDELFVALLARAHTRNHYAQPEQRFHHHMYRARQVLDALSVVALVAGVLWSGTQIVDGLLYRQEAARTTQVLAEAEQYQAELHARLPQTDVEPEDMRAAVASADHLQRERRDPHVLLARLGQALQTQPGLQVEQIDWFVSRDRQATAAERSDDEVAAIEPEYDADGNPLDTDAGAGADGSGYQIGVLSGRIDPFEGDYGRAHAAIESLLTTLRASPGVLAAEALSLPLNTASSGRVLGGIGDVERKPEAPFRLRLVMGGADG